MLKRILTWFLCIAIPMATGALSGYLTRDESGGLWYNQLEKPWFQPPSWVFGPVWTTLYLLMGISLYLVYTSPRSRLRTWALAIFAVQLVLNFFWSLIFFRFHQLGLASLEIVLLWASIFSMIIVFVRIRPLAGYLQIPYIAWTSFATVLTITIYSLNQ